MSVTITIRWGNLRMISATVTDALAVQLGRTPTKVEIATEVRRIIRGDSK